MVRSPDVCQKLCKDADNFDQRICCMPTEEFFKLSFPVMMSGHMDAKLRYIISKRDDLPDECPYVLEHMASDYGTPK